MLPCIFNLLINTGNLIKLLSGYACSTSSLASVCTFESGRSLGRIFGTDNIKMHRLVKPRGFYFVPERRWQGQGRCCYSEKAHNLRTSIQQRRCRFTGMAVSSFAFWRSVLCCFMVMSLAIHDVPGPLLLDVSADSHDFPCHRQKQKQQWKAGFSFP